MRGARPAVVLSSMYVLKGDYAQALRYADISVARIDDSSYWDANKAYVWYNYGDVCASAGDDAGPKLLIARHWNMYRRPVSRSVSGPMYLSETSV